MRANYRVELASGIFLLLGIVAAFVTVFIATAVGNDNLVTRAVTKSCRYFRTNGRIIGVAYPLPFFQLQMLVFCKSKMFIELRRRANDTVAFMAVTERQRYHPLYLRVVDDR